VISRNNPLGELRNLTLRKELIFPEGALQTTIWRTGNHTDPEERALVSGKEIGKAGWLLDRVTLFSKTGGCGRARRDNPESTS